MTCQGSAGWQWQLSELTESLTSRLVAIKRVADVEYTVTGIFISKIFRYRSKFI